MAQLRSTIFIDQLQPQTHALVCSLLPGPRPRQRMAMQLIDLTPSIVVERLADQAIKYEDVGIGLAAVAANFGFLEIHSADPCSVKSAADAALEAADVDSKTAPKAETLASNHIDRVTPEQAMVINRSNNGSAVMANEALYILQTSPATVALKAANEAEKAADIKLVSCTFTGARGRVYISGTAEAVRAAAEAAEQVIGAE